MMAELARRVIQCYEDFDGFVHWLKLHERVGSLKSVEIDRERKAVSIRGIINTGFSLDHIDPVNLLVILGLAFFGPFWPYMPDVKEAFKLVKKWWKSQTKKKKVKKNQ